VVIESGDIVFFYWKTISELRSITCHMAAVDCATPATLWSYHLSRKDVGRTVTAPTRRSPGLSARTAAVGIIAAVWDTSTDNTFANSVDNFFDI